MVACIYYKQCIIPTIDFSRTAGFGMQKNKTLIIIHTSLRLSIYFSIINEDNYLKKNNNRYENCLYFGVLSSTNLEVGVVPINYFVSRRHSRRVL